MLKLQSRECHNYQKWYSEFTGNTFTKPTPNRKYIKLLQLIQANGYCPKKVCNEFLGRSPRGFYHSSEYLFMMLAFGFIRKYRNEHGRVFYKISAKGTKLLKKAYAVT